MVLNEDVIFSGALGKVKLLGMSGGAGGAGGDGGNGHPVTVVVDGQLVIFDPLGGKGGDGGAGAGERDDAPTEWHPCFGRGGGPSRGAFNGR